MSNNKHIKHYPYRHDHNDETSDMDTEGTQGELEMETKEKEIKQQYNQFDVSSGDSTSLSYSEGKNVLDLRQSNTMSYSLPLPVLVPIPIITPYITRTYPNVTMNSSKCCSTIGNHSSEADSLSSNQLVLGVKLPFSALDSQIRAKPPPFVRIPPPLSTNHYHRHHQHHSLQHHHQQQSLPSALIQQKEINIKEDSSCSSPSLLSIQEPVIIANKSSNYKSTNNTVNSKKSSNDSYLSKSSNDPQYINLQNISRSFNNNNNNLYITTDTTINTTTNTTNQMRNNSNDNIYPSTYDKGSSSNKLVVLPSRQTIESKLNTVPSNESMKKSIGTMITSYSTITSRNPSTECVIVNEMASKNLKPRVAFIEPVNKQTSTTSTTNTTTNGDNNVINKFEISNTQNNQSTNESNNKIKLINNEKKPVDKLKLSLSDRFPGWGVITDDDDDDDDDEDANVNADENNVQWEEIITNLENIKQSPLKRDAKYDRIENKNYDIHENTSNKYEETMNTNCNINNDKITMKFPSINEQYSNSNLSQSSNIINDEETIFQVNQQQQYWQPFPRQISIEKRRHSSILTNPRKSLAMIFSQISNNLGFTQETSINYSNEHYSSNFHLNTRRISSSGKRLKQMISKHNTNTNDNNNTNYDNALFNSDADIHKKSSRSSFIQQHNDLNLDNNNNNNTIGIRSSVSSQRLMERSIFNTIIGGNPNQHRTSGSIGTLSNVHYNKSNNPNTILTSNNNNNNTMSPTTTTVDRSILVDLLCCTCCTNSDDEDEAYSNLIENHRLARIVTMGAILTILGLIFAYIIRSATETQTVPNASSTTGSPPSSPAATTTTTLTVATTVTNVTDIETYSSFFTTTNTTLNLIMNSTLNPQFIKQMSNVSSFLNLTHNDESNSVRVLNDSYVYNHVNSKLISTNDDNNNESHNASSY
ncbi:hypothetical protein MS3_00009531 [Schistosoma haematobium]|uniref:Uncharacterized protein n=1 Tax=Schistosoma haematobium TaxID=6185 RepID=A0A922LD53_SCHHA|nr:hypothetical protein MS3_00009531 [Schistosoma haematobium]KAH9579350.1 hypothetical protein MS3_00009531 [Schistosoma haematobium]CAH8632111.1 unnamed protein product [Schistosoma haematobium]